MNRRTRLLLLMLAGLTCVLVFTSAAEAAAPKVAPPATPRVQAACDQRAAAGKATEDETTHVPHGPITLSGCVSDTSGISHVLVRWNQGDTHGRICTDPVVTNGVWACTWDTTQLPNGKYELELIAVDAAGNEGSSKRKYAIDDRQLIPPTAAATPTAPATPVTPVTPANPSPAPAPAVPTQPEVPTPPADAEQTPTLPDASPPQFSAVQQLVIDRVQACENGGVDDHPTDDPAVTSQLDQVQLVLDCLSPALSQAGADESEVRNQPPLPMAIVVHVADPLERADLDAALPDTIAGVPVLVVEPVPVAAPSAPADVVPAVPADA